MLLLTKKGKVSRVWVPPVVSLEESANIYIRVFLISGETQPGMLCEFNFFYALLKNKNRIISQTVEERSPLK